MPRKPGPGRPRLGGRRVAVRLSEPQHAALAAAAREARVDLSTFVREMALRGAGLAQLSEHAWLAEGKRMIRTAIGNGLRTDDACSLVLVPARDAVPRWRAGFDGDGLVVAVETNAGPVYVPTTDIERIDAACRDLGCTPQELRAAVIAAHADAADWDWAPETSS